MFVRLRLPLFEPLMSVVESFFPYSVPFRLFISSFFSHGIHSLFLFFFFSVTVVFCHLHQTPVLLFFFFSISLMQYMAFFFFESSPIISELLFLVFLFFFPLPLLTLVWITILLSFFFFLFSFELPPKKKWNSCAHFFFSNVLLSDHHVGWAIDAAAVFFFPPSGRRELQTFLSLGREEG